MKVVYQRQSLATAYALLSVEKKTESERERVDESCFACVEKKTESGRERVGENTQVALLVLRKKTESRR